MQRLLRHESSLYDANILLFYCFYHSIPRRTREPYVITARDGLTPLARKITTILIENKKTISAIQTIIDEVDDPRIAAAVKVRTCDEDVRKSIGLLRAQPFPLDLELQIIEKVKKTFRKFKANPWFRAIAYSADQSRLEALRDFYRRANSDPTLASRRHPSKGKIPSSNDLLLVLSSGDKSLPVLSHDSDLTAYSRELVDAEFATEIVPITDVKFE